MPCIHARKSELAEIARRFPAELERVQEWERMVSLASKRGTSTLYRASTNPATATKNNHEINLDDHGIMSVAQWAKTSRGGRQFDLLATDKPPICSSAYGLCE